MVFVLFESGCMFVLCANSETGRELNAFVFATFQSCKSQLQVMKSCSLYQLIQLVNILLNSSIMLGGFAACSQLIVPRLWIVDIKALVHLNSKKTLCRYFQFYCPDFKTSIRLKWMEFHLWHSQHQKTVNSQTSL